MKKLRYTTEFKAELIRQAKDLSQPIPYLAKTYRVSAASLYRWLVDIDGPSLRVRRRLVEQFTDEIARLQSQSAKLQEERDLLVKTVQMFARLAT